MAEVKTGIVQKISSRQRLGDYLSSRHSETPRHTKATVRNVQQYMNPAHFRKWGTSEVKKRAGRPFSVNGFLIGIALTGPPIAQANVCTGRGNGMVKIEQYSDLGLGKGLGGGGILAGFSASLFLPL